MSLIKFDSSKLTPFVHENELSEMQAMVNAANTVKVLVLVTISVVGLICQ